MKKWLGSKNDVKLTTSIHEQAGEPPGALEQGLHGRTGHLVAEVHC